MHGTGIDTRHVVEERDLCALTSRLQPMLSSCCLLLCILPMHAALYVERKQRLVRVPADLAA